MPNSIRLAGQDYPVAALKFRDLKRVLPLFLELGIDTEAKLDAQGEILTAAVRTADPNFTRAAFDDLSPTLAELHDAVSAVAVLSGLQRRAAQPGEAPGGEPFRWGDIYGLIATACGYRRPEIDEMTLPEFEELAAYWRRHPPAHLLLGALFRPKREKKGDLADLFTHFGWLP